MSDAPLTISHATLRTLHRIHRQLRDLNEQVDRYPRQVQAGQAAIDALQAEVDQAREQLKQARMACDRKQLQLKEREQNLEDLGSKLNTAASNREFQTIKERIAADRQANEVLADEIFEGLEGLDVLAANVKSKEAELQQREADHATLLSEVEGKMTVLDSDLKRVQAELTETEKGLPAAVMGTYERLIRSKGEEGLAPVEGQSCGNCGSTFAPQMMNRLILKHYVTCPTCAAILYVTEDSVDG